MKKILYSFALVLACVYPVKAQVMGNAQYNSNNDYSSRTNNSIPEKLVPNDNEILIQVNGLMNTVADSYVAVFSLMQVGETTDDIDQKMNDRINAFCNNLKAVGINDDNITTDLISVVPNYDIHLESKIFSKSYNEEPAGFEMQKNISIHYTKASQLDAIMNAALRAEIYDLVKSDYFIKDISTLRDSLRTACMKELNRKIKTYEMAGIKFDSMKKSIVDNNSTILPSARYMTYQAFARPSLKSINKKYGYNDVSKSLSKYYNPVDYSQYDIVINPVITEPVVQLSYSVVVKYISQEKTTEKTYYMLTPSGEMKQLILK